MAAPSGTTRGSRMARYTRRPDLELRRASGPCTRAVRAVREDRDEGAAARSGPTEVEPRPDRGLRAAGTPEPRSTRSRRAGGSCGAPKAIAHPDVAPALLALGFQRTERPATGEAAGSRGRRAPRRPATPRRTSPPYSKISAGNGRIEQLRSRACWLRFALPYFLLRRPPWLPWPLARPWAIPENSCRARRACWSQSSVSGSPESLYSRDASTPTLI